MSDELDLYSNGGQVVPWDPAGQPLAPTADDWGSDVDYLSEHSLTAPSGALQPEVEQIFNQLASVFLNDAAAMGIDFGKAQKAMGWFRSNLANPPQGRQPRTHGFNLHEHNSDELFHAFAMQAKKWNWSQQQISNLCWWVSECERILTNGTPAPAQESAPSTDPLANLSDEQFAYVEKLNLQEAARTQDYLKRKWGQSYLANMNTLRSYFASLPIGEQEFLNQYDRNWVNGLNSIPVLEGLFANAVGAGSLPSGGGVQSEISSIENLMRTHPKAYRSDLRLQARLRVLYGLRDGH